MASSANVGSAKSPTFKHLFELLDKDRNGVIDPNEFLYIKDLYKVIDSEETIYDLIKEADVDQSGDLDFNEFCNILTKLRMPDVVVDATTQTVTQSEESLLKLIRRLLYVDPAVILRSSIHFAAGGIAGALSRTMVSPLERIKILYQIQGAGKSQYSGVFSTLGKIAREEGFRGYFKGNGTNIVRIVPYSAVQFAAYEYFKKLLIRPGEDDLDTRGRLKAGALAGITSVTVTYPLDLVRTRLSAQTDSRKYTGIVQAMKLVVREEGGYRALYKGLSPTIMGIAPYVALNFTVYESIRAWHRARFDEPSAFLKLGYGAIAGTVGQTVTYPLDVIRRRFQMTGATGQFKYRSTSHAIWTIVKSEGIRGLYKGMLPNLLKVAPAISVSFYTYESMKKILYDLGDSKD